MVGVRLQRILVFVMSLLIIGYATWFSISLRKEMRKNKVLPIPFLETRTPWVDSVMNRMGLEEKIGQMIIVVADADTLDDNQLFIKTIEEFNVGGIIYQNFSAYQQNERSKLYQKFSNIPLLIGTKGSVNDPKMIQVPNDLMMSNLSDSSIFHLLAEKVGEQNTQLGVGITIQTINHLNDHVLTSNAQFLSKLQERRTLGIVHMNNFPNVSGLDSLDWIQQMQPFFKLKDYRISALWLDSLLLKNEGIFRKGYTGLPEINELRNRLDYKGLLLGDIPKAMKGNDELTHYIDKLLISDVDMLVVHDQVAEISSIVKDLINRKILSEKKLDDKVRRILKAKAWTGAVKYHQNVKNEEDPPHFVNPAPLLNVDLHTQSTTILQDPDSVLPLNNTRGNSFHMVTIGQKMLEFQRTFKHYASISESILKTDTVKGLPNIYSKYRRYDRLIVVMNGIRIDSVRDNRFIESLDRLALRRKVILVNLGSLNYLAELTTNVCVVHGYGTHPISQQVMGQMLFGGRIAKGELPIDLNSTWKEGTGIHYPEVRLNYIPENIAYQQWPSLSVIDSIVEESISEKAIPGCQILVAQKGSIIFHKSFGYHTYGKRRKVQLEDVYDIASVTKIAATTQAAMYLKDKDRITLDQPLGRFFSNRLVEVESGILKDSLGNPMEMVVDTITRKAYQAMFMSDSTYQVSLQGIQREISVPMSTAAEHYLKLGDSLVVRFRPKRRIIRKRPAIFDVSIEELLTHHSGLPAGMPVKKYVLSAIKGLDSYERYYKKSVTLGYDIKIAGDFFFRNDLKDSLWRDIKLLPVFDKENYEYSDVNMVVLQQALDSIMKRPINEWLDKSLYQPLGLKTLRYLPRETINSRRIIPTENDTRWRRQLLRGYVHDPAAALMGGVAGNAGLFSNANDLAILMQLMLNKGTYGGKRYYKSETVDEFTTRKKGHRAYGFDMPPHDEEYIIAPSASFNSYGHLGFTGTCVWVDPDSEMIFVFLSNRVYPSSGNWKINTLQVRQRIHEAVYKALDERVNA